MKMFDPTSERNFVCMICSLRIKNMWPTSSLKGAEKSKAGPFGLQDIAITVEICIFVPRLAFLVLDTHN